MKRTTRTDGCRLLQVVRDTPPVLAVNDLHWEHTFSVARQKLCDTANRVPAILDPLFRLQDGDQVDLLDIRPPFPRVWIEISAPGADHLGYLVEHHLAQDEKPEHVVITGYLLQPKIEQRALATTSVKFYLDERGNGLEYRVLTTASLANRAPAQEYQIHQTYPALKVLQCCNAINVGLHERRDPAESDRSLPRFKRRAAIAYRHYILTIRSALEIRAGRKIVDAPGSMPLNTARGHWRHYGEQYGRGLLFGKYDGRLWIPSHARGKAENGVIDKDYRLPA